MITRCGRGAASSPDGEGIGVAIGWWPGGYEPAAAACRLDSDGNLTVITGAADMTGVETDFATIAAEAFGVDPTGSASSTPTRRARRTPASSGGSKVTYTVGRAVQRAARQARERLLDVAAEELEIAPEDLEIVDGSVQPVRACRRKAIAIEELAAEDPRRSAARIRRSRDTDASSLPQAPQSAAHLSHVRVDPRYRRGDRASAT